ncbi:putative beta-D-xylosidase 7 [Gossypium australe]|uniref:Putative beta-D-xylosidase 7 n=1 Tax=Gossypium australe TaxID=47621 RepID=A0A5B6WVI7_9ROSI|nr:putative beta-D-xylosidase 7 [Gossypium australe]
MNLTGMDADCGSYLLKYIKSAVEKQKLSLYEIDRALYNLFSIKMRLGLFNGNPVKQPFGNIGLDQICSKEHQNLALEAACNGIVLLKNAKKLILLSKTETTSLTVIGPNANSEQTLLGNYASPPCKTITPLKGLQSYVKDTRFHQGCSAVNCSSAFTDQAMNVATGADRVVLVIGLDQTQEREKFDRVDLVLPPKQQNLISTIARAAKNPIILVLLSGGPVHISFAKNDPQTGSILWAGYPSEAGGRALAEIIFGDHNLEGRRIYRFYQGPKVFEFAYGLSYSNYTYELLPVKRNKVYLHNQVSSHVVENSNPPGYIHVSKIGTEICDKIKYQVTVRVENNGEMAGKHSLLLFVRLANMSNMRSVKQLVAFQSVNLNARERVKIELELKPCEHLNSANEDGTMVIEEGSYFLSIGDKEIEIQAVK